MFENVRTNIIAAGILLSLAGIAPAQAQQQIRIVGSSTVFPFATAVAERFGRNTDFRTPIVESTGSGGGLKLFCSGIGQNTPDITNSSRRIKQSEVDLCEKNGVDGIIELKIGFDGIVLGNSLEAPAADFTRREIFLALARDIPTEDGSIIANPFSNWSDINPALPDIAIEVMGPPPTSGTRDAFVELVMEEGCKSFEWVRELGKNDKQAYQALCQTIREDGAYVEAGENDNLIVQKLVANPDAYGIFGFSFLDSNTDLIKGNSISGVLPEFENIASGDYPVSRSLYVYVKRAHLDLVPGIREFLAEFTSENTWGPDGYLADKGLIPMPDDDRDLWAARARNLELLQFGQDQDR